MTESHAPVLLVEDNPLDLDLTRRAFARRRLQNPILVARDGEEALDFVFCRGSFASRPADPPLVILLDIKLPKVDGLEVLRQVRADTSTRHVPVVMMTSSREGPDIQTSYELGANAYVVKPLSFSEFSEAVRRIGMFWILTNEPLV